MVSSFSSSSGGTGGTAAAAAATKIQSLYRGHLTRVLVRRVRAAGADADRIERRLRQQSTVDAVRHGGKEGLLLSESLMSALLRLDEVQGLYPAVRDLRRSVSRRIVALQEVLDAIARGVDPDIHGDGSAAVCIPGSLDELISMAWDGSPATAMKTVMTAEGGVYCDGRTWGTCSFWDV